MQNMQDELTISAPGIAYFIIFFLSVLHPCRSQVPGVIPGIVSGPALGLCPPGQNPNGQCQVTSICVDKGTICVGGTCCTQGYLNNGQISQCPQGTFPTGNCGGFTGLLKFHSCIDANTKCYGATCCTGTPGAYGLGGFGLGLGGVGIDPTLSGGLGYGYGGGLGLYGAYSGALGYGYGGIGDYPGAFGGYGGFLDAGLGHDWLGGYGGIGLGCVDSQVQCFVFRSFCRLDAIKEACLGSCGACGLVGGLGGYGLGRLGYGDLGLGGLGGGLGYGGLGG